MSKCACCGQPLPVTTSASTAIEVDARLHKLCMDAHNDATRQGVACVEIAHLVWRASMDAARAENDPRARLQHYDLGQAAEAWLAAHTHPSQTAAPTTSADLKSLLQRAHHSARRNQRSRATVQDLMTVLVQEGSDLPSAAFASTATRAPSPAAQPSASRQTVPAATSAHQTFGHASAYTNGRNRAQSSASTGQRGSYQSTGQSGTENRRDNYRPADGRDTRHPEAGNTASAPRTSVRAHEHDPRRHDHDWQRRPDRDRQPSRTHGRDFERNGDRDRVRHGERQRLRNGEYHDEHGGEHDGEYHDEHRGEYRGEYRGEHYAAREQNSARAMQSRTDPRSAHLAAGTASTPPGNTALTDRIASLENQLAVLIEHANRSAPQTQHDSAASRQPAANMSASNAATSTARAATTSASASAAQNSASSSSSRARETRDAARGSTGSSASNSASSSSTGATSGSTRNSNANRSTSSSSQRSNSTHSRRQWSKAQWSKRLRTRRTQRSLGANDRTYAPRPARTPYEPLPQRAYSTQQSTAERYATPKHKRRWQPDDDDILDEVAKDQDNDADSDDDTGDGADRPKRFYLAPDDDIVRAPSIGPRTAERLVPAGLFTVRDLLTCDPERAASLVTSRHITAKRIASWQTQAHLVCIIPWLRGTHAQLLAGAGFDTLERITDTDPADACAAILKFAATRMGQSCLRSGPPPDIERIKRWLDHAGLAEPERAA